MPVPDMIDASNLIDDDTTPEAKEQKDRGIALWVRNHARPILVSGGAILGRKVGEDDNEMLVDLTDYNGYKLGVSRRHAQIDCTGHGCLLLDLGSSNGTWINGLRLQPYQPAVLRSGDRIYLARLEIIVGPISDEALRRAHHIPHGMSRPSPIDSSVPSDRKTDSLDPGQQKATVPVEQDLQPPDKDNGDKQAPETSAQAEQNDLKATIASPPNNNGVKPAPANVAEPEASKPKAATSEAAKPDAAKPDAGTPDTAKPDAPKPDAAPQASDAAAKAENKDDDKSKSDNNPESKNGTASDDKPGDQS